LATPSPAHHDSHPRLPLDPDQPPVRTPSWPPHLRLRLVGAVALGGLVGAPARYGLAVLLPAGADRFPWATFVVNVAGSALLGLLLDVVVERAPDGDSVARLLRHLLGVGLLGAFTTYSTFALEADLSLRQGNGLLAASYVLASLVAGLLACAAGIGAGRFVPLPERWRAREPVDAETAS
jgi:CrcB protein